MYKSKLLDLLRSMSEDERSLLAPYLEYQAALGRVSEAAILLYDYVQRHFDNENTLHKEKVWHALFGDKAPVRDAHLRKIMHELNRASVDFLIAENLTKKEQLQRQVALELSWPRGLTKHYRTLERQTQDYFDNEALRDEQYHLEQAQYYDLAYRRAESGTKRAQLANLLRQKDHHLDAYYFIQKLRNYCNSISNRVFFSLEGDELALPNGFLGQVAASRQAKEIGVRMYLSVARMLENPGEAHWFQELKQLLKEASHHFSLNEQDNLYIFLKNYCIGYQINQGNSQYFQELFELSRTLLDKGITQRNGVITPQAYKNLITVGLHVQAFDWTEQFIRDFTDLLPPEERYNALNYNLAKVFFAQGDYNRVIEQLREVAYANHTYALGSKLMLLKTYYELGEDRALDSLIDSFRIYLRRNRAISREVRQQYQNLLRFVRKLFYLPPQSSEVQVKLRKEVEACEPLADKAWILSKVGTGD